MSVVRFVLCVVCSFICVFVVWGVCLLVGVSV